MTDKDKLVTLLSEFGVGFSDEDNIVECREGMDNVDGYTYFFTYFKFDDDGKFISMGALE